MAEQIQYIITAVDRTKAAFTQIQASFGRLEKSALSVRGAFTGIAALGALGGISASLRNSIGELAALDDAAEATGASVESLSSLLNTLAPSGVSLEQISDIAGKIARAMAGADEESSKAGEAFRALGVATRDAAGNLRSVDDVVVDVALALNRYADGTNKTAIAQALFGKSGAALLPILKDLATEQRQASTVTAEQAAAAEKAEKSLRRLNNEMTLMRQELVSSLIPGLSDFLGKLRSIAAISGNPIKWAEFLFGSASDIDAEVSRIESEIKRLQGIVDNTAPADGGRNQRDQAGGLLGTFLERFTGTEAQQAEARKRLLELQRDLQVAKAVQRSQQTLGVSGVRQPQAPFSDARFAAGQRPAPRLAGDETKKIRDQRSEAQRLLETLEQQLDRTRELTTEQEVLARIGRGEIEGLTPALEQQILLRAAQVDAVKAEQKAREELRKTIDALAESEAKEQEALQRARLPLDGRLADEAARILKELPAARQKFAAELTRYFDERFLDGLLPEADWKAAIERINGLQTQVSDDSAKTADAARDLGLTFQSAFEDAIQSGSKFSDVLKGLGQDIAKIFLRQQITAPLANFISKGASSLFGGQTLFDLILGKRADGGPVEAGRAYLVGEMGSELFVPATDGKIVPNSSLGGGGVTIVNRFANGMTPMDVANAAHIAAAQAKREILESMSRRGAYARA